MQLFLSVPVSIGPTETLDDTVSEFSGPKAFFMPLSKQL